MRPNPDVIAGSRMGLAVSLFAKSALGSTVKVGEETHRLPARAVHALAGSRIRTRPARSSALQHTHLIVAAPRFHFQLMLENFPVYVGEFSLYVVTDNSDIGRSTRAEFPNLLSVTYNNQRTIKAETVEP
jgi:hypothetical protein